MPKIPGGIQPKAKPWPGYFLVRTTGEVVPLIAVDELPTTIELVDVPRSLDLEETIGMVNLGLQKSTGGFYQIASEEGSKIPNNEVAGQADNRCDLALQSSSLSKPSMRSSSASGTPFLMTTTALTSSTTANSPTSPAATQQCRHWCRHGICKWGQQCRYQHVMPMTLHGLHEVGLQDWPLWFRKENPGYFISDVRSAGVSARIGRARRVPGNGIGAGDCCGSPHAVGSRAERLRGGGRLTVRERGSSKVLRSEELGEQIIVRLRSMSKDVVGQKTVATHGGTAKIERAAARDTKNWEDESEEEAGEDGTDVEEEAKSLDHGKLVDV